MDSKRPESPNLGGLLEELCAAGVEFILVGGLAAVAQGAPISTVDIDIVPKKDPENLQRLLSLLQNRQARFRGRPENQLLRPILDDLMAGGHCLLMTDMGPLDILGKIEEDLGYEDLRNDVVELSFKGHQLKILSLEAMIRIKQHSTRKKDRLLLPILQETLKAKNDS